MFFFSHNVSKYPSHLVFLKVKHFKQEGQDDPVMLHCINRIIIHIKIFDTFVQYFSPMASVKMFTPQANFDPGAIM